MLPQNRPGDADIGTGDNDAVDVAPDAAVGGDEAELLAVIAMGAQVEARGAQPAYRQGLELVGSSPPARMRSTTPAISAWSQSTRLGKSATTLTPSCSKRTGPVSFPASRRSA